MVVGVGQGRLEMGVGSSRGQAGNRGGQTRWREKVEKGVPTEGGRHAQEWSWVQA